MFSRPSPRVLPLTLKFCRSLSTSECPRGESAENTCWRILIFSTENQSRHTAARPVRCCWCCPPLLSSTESTAAVIADLAPSLEASRNASRNPCSTPEGGVACSAAALGALLLNFLVFCLVGSCWVVDCFLHCWLFSHKRTAQPRRARGGGCARPPEPLSAFPRGTPRTTGRTPSPTQSEARRLLQICRFVVLPLLPFVARW